MGNTFITNCCMEVLIGKSFMGGMENANLLSPEQQQFLSDAFSGQGAAGGAYGQFLQPQNYEKMFQENIVEPTTRAYEQRVVPGLQQRFVDANASSSSALNQALAQGASDLTSSLGGQYMNFLQGQQQNTLGALGQLGGLAGTRSFQPMQQQGNLGDILKAIIAGAGLFI